MAYFGVGVAVSILLFLLWEYRATLLNEIDRLSDEKLLVLDRVVKLEKDRLDQEEITRHEESQAIPDITIDDLFDTVPGVPSKDQDNSATTLPGEPIPLPAERREGRLVPDSQSDWGSIRLRVLSSKRNREGSHLGQTSGKVAQAGK